MYIPKSLDRRKIICAFAKEYLSRKERHPGVSYYEHGFEIAKILEEVTKSSKLFNVALLHSMPRIEGLKDVLYQAPITKDEHALILQLSNTWHLNIVENSSDLNSLIEMFEKDPRLCVLRTIHQLNEIRNIHRYSETEKKNLASETLYMMSSIADKFGMRTWKQEMEDRSFQILHPNIAEKLQAKFNANFRLDQISLESAKEILTKELKRAKLEGIIQCRIKRLYSTYKKMVLKKRKFDELTDRLGLRIIVKNTQDCYKALYLVHRIMHPIPGKLKDYIGAPKENGYKSIHTVVYPIDGFEEQAFEIQIRTSAMDSICKYGIAAHQKYKEKNYKIKTSGNMVNLFKNLEFTQKSTMNPSEFRKTLKECYGNDYIVVSDEENNLHKVKNPSTVLDFAFQIDKNKCKRIKKVKVNGKTTSLDTELKNGDIVEIAYGRQNTINKFFKTQCLQKDSRTALNEIIKNSN